MVHKTFCACGVAPCVKYLPPRPDYETLVRTKWRGKANYVALRTGTPTSPPREGSSKPGSAWRANWENHRPTKTTELNIQAAT